MYITETTDNVKKLFEELEIKTDEQKLKFLIYVFGLLNNNQINDKNEPNPDLVENENIEIFTLSSIGFAESTCNTFLQYLAMAYNMLTKSKDAYIDNGNVLGISSDDEDKKFESYFEKLNFNEKLDVFSEILIRYDNETYFKDKLPIITFAKESDGYTIASMIKDYKNKLVK